MCDIIKWEREGYNKKKFTEEMLKSYSAPLSDSEDQQCKNTIRMVRDALKEMKIRQ